MKTFYKILIILILTLPVIEVFAQPPMPTNYRELSLKVILQGLYNTTNHTMNQCKSDNLATNKFSGTIADTIIIELHDAANYSTIIYSSINDNIGKNIELNQNGIVNTTGKSYIEIPFIYSGNYYITVKTRNHLETTSASTISFANKTIIYDFSTAASQAYGNNQKLLEPGVYGIYAGDINHDGYITLVGDRSPIQQSAVAATTGYVNEDINGDGFVTLVGDRSPVNQNAINSIHKQTP